MCSKFCDFLCSGEAVYLSLMDDPVPYVKYAFFLKALLSKLLHIDDCLHFFAFDVLFEAPSFDFTLVCACSGENCQQELMLPQKCAYVASKLNLYLISAITSFRDIASSTYSWCIVDLISSHSAAI